MIKTALHFVWRCGECQPRSLDPLLRKCRRLQVLESWNSSMALESVVSFVEAGQCPPKTISGE